MAIRKIYAPVALLDEVSNTVSVSEGGTGANTALKAVENIGGISKTKINAPGGVVGLDNNERIKDTFIPVSIANAPAVLGPLSLSINQAGTYTITNYNSFITYALEAITGTVTRSGATIIYTAPADTGTGGFRINGKLVSVAVSAVQIGAPMITSPAPGAEGVGSSVDIVGGIFTTSGVSDTHLATDWQIATDSAFGNVVKYSTADTVNKTNWSVAGLAANTTYYVRARYKGTTYGYGAWSTVVSFKTKVNFLPSTETAILSASNKVMSDALGNYVALDGTGLRCVVGCKLKNSNSKAEAGVAYVFIRAGNTWTQEAILTASDEATGINFGSSVAISSSGDRVVIGSTGNDAVYSDAGAAYVFLRTGTTWAQEVKLIPSGSTINDKAGECVSIDSTGTRCAVGARMADVSGKINAGCVYIFLRTGTTWVQEACLTASVPTISNYFGFSVALSVDASRIAIGAWGVDTADGAVYVFSRSGTTWVQEAKLTTDYDTNEQMGYSVAIDGPGSVIFTGSVVGSVGGLSSGFVTLFTRSGSTWTKTTTLNASDSQTGSSFGCSLATNNEGNILVVGAYAADLPSAQDAGAVYIFAKEAGVWSQKNKLVSTSPAAHDYFGTYVSVCNSKDIVAISTPGKDISENTDAGCVFIFT